MTIRFTNRSNLRSSNSLRRTLVALLVAGFIAAPAAMESGVRVAGGAEAVAVVADSAEVDSLLSSRLGSEQLEQGWIRLFDGVTTFGWENAGTGNWRVEGGALWADQGEDSLICTKVAFADFELALEYLAQAETNSGVFVRTIEKPVDIKNDCLEVNVAPDSNPFPTGSIVYRQKRSEEAKPAKVGEWNRMRILCERAKTKVWVNDQLVVEYDGESNLRKGKIGLQFRAGKIGYKNILLRPIGETLLPGNKAAFLDGVKVDTTWNEDGTLTIVGGRGHVETKAKIGSGFVQYRATTLVPNVNSGLFFRCIPGEDMNGYECQLHHGFKENRSVPLDSGTGAIFRRQPARAVLSDEGKPAFVTIVADGPTIATWVQGVQVVDFTDTRKVDPNPRRGLRTEAGSLMLQGHDPECKVRFESLRIGSYD